MNNYCSNCGEAIDEDANVCTYCGTELDSPDASAQESQAVLVLFSYLGSLLMYLLALGAFSIYAESGVFREALTGSIFVIGATITLPRVKTTLNEAFDIYISPGLSLFISVMLTLIALSVAP